MQTTRDLIVIGGGSAGLSAARFAAKLGLNIAIVETARLGGDCTWSGCVPSKALLHIAKVAQGMRTTAGLGITPVTPIVDFSEVMAHVRQVREQVYRQESPDALREEGIDIMTGAARFAAPDSIRIGDQTVTARRFLIATGARPFVPSVPGLERVSYHTYETIWDLEALPGRLLVVGAGPIGCELAQAFRRLGSAVALIDMADRPLPLEEPEASEALRSQLASEGVTLYLNTPLQRVDRDNDEIVLTAGGLTIRGDVLLMALGRRANVEGLGLDAAGVRFSPQGIEVDRFLRSTQRRIYAAGDCSGGFQFTHYAGWQGVMAVRNAFLPGSSPGVLDSVPWTTFTDPEVAHAGLTEAAARARFGEQVTVAVRPMAAVDRAITDGQTSGFVRVVQGPGQRIAGATVVGPHAGELIQEWVFAMERRMRLADLASAIHVYPTYGFATWQLSGEARTEALLRGWRGRATRWLARRAS